MTFTLTRRRLGLSLVALSGVAASPRAFAQAGKPILTVSGKIDATGGTVQFDREALEKLGLVSFETATPWYAGKVKFEGVPLKLLMKQAGASGKTIQALALNDYSTDIPMTDIEKYNVILALKRDGEYMPVRDKGPLFVVYPYDSDPELRSQQFYGRSAWQVKAFVIK